jgi:hypothetical protein
VIGATSEDAKKKREAIKNVDLKWGMMSRRKINGHGTTEMMRKTISIYVLALTLGVLGVSEAAPPVPGYVFTTIDWPDGAFGEASETVVEGIMMTVIWWGYTGLGI